MNAQGLRRCKFTPVYENAKHPHSTIFIVKVKQITIFVLYWVFRVEAFV